jgi:pyridoxamine 5'-phosphate oxidase
MSFANTVRAIITMGRGMVGGLSELRAGDDPLQVFRTWFDEASRAGILMPEAMTLATATRVGIPSARMVLLKGFDARGFVFFTNYESRKATELDENPNAALCFHWTVLQRQVRIEGSVERVSQQESEAYFRTRPRGSRIGAWASRQSRPLDSREILETRVREFDSKHPGNAVPLPPFWGGYRLMPGRIEFWQGRTDRLHDRLLFQRNAKNAWSVQRLYP